MKVGMLPKALMFVGGMMSVGTSMAQGKEKPAKKAPQKLCYYQSVKPAMLLAPKISLYDRKNNRILVKEVPKDNIVNDSPEKDNYQTYEISLTSKYKQQLEQEHGKPAINNSILAKVEYWAFVLNPSNPWGRSLHGYEIMPQMDKTDKREEVANGLGDEEYPHCTPEQMGISVGTEYPNEFGVKRAFAPEMLCYSPYLNDIVLKDKQYLRLGERGLSVERADWEFRVTSICPDKSQSYANRMNFLLSSS